MSIQRSLPVTIAQMGHVEKLAEATQNQPVVQQKMAQEAAKNTLERQKTQVSATENAKDTKALEEKEKEKKHQHPKKRTKNKPSSQQTDLDAAAPETGNILNIIV